MSGDHQQAHQQRIEAHLRRLDEQVSILSRLNDAAANERIGETFDDNPRNVIVYRGVQLGKTQRGIAAALKDRDLPAATQQRVSETLVELAEAGFIVETKGGYRLLEGWDSAYRLEKVLKKTLRRHKVDDLT